MDSTPFSGLANVRANCKLTVAIPARNEAAHIAGTLEALHAQRSIDARALEAGLFDIIVFANASTDGTAEAVRAWSARRPQIATHIVEADLPRDAAHVGTARKLVMDAAAERFIARDFAAGIVASTDADTVPDETWIAWTLREAQGADAVTGRIVTAARESHVPAPAFEELYRLEETYRQALAELEALDDPLPHDPFPRHAQHFGASFAVTAAAYTAAGGIAPLAYLEDLDFYHRLLRIDARVRHSPFVRVTTSSRRSARVTGGFATFLRDLESRAANGETLFVEDPRATRARIRARSALRRIYECAPFGDERAAIADVYGDSEAAIASLDRARPFGAHIEQLEGPSQATLSLTVPIATAIVTLQRMLAASMPPALAGAPLRPGG